ncbi:hypothetical protein H4R21_003927, partial [Coemansia helicoidea]
LPGPAGAPAGRLWRHGQRAAAVRPHAAARHRHCHCRRRRRCRRCHVPSPSPPPPSAAGHGRRLLRHGGPPRRPVLLAHAHGRPVRRPDGPSTDAAPAAAPARQSSSPRPGRRNML